MTAQELIDRLERLIEEGEIEDDTEVRLAYQPNYPLQSHVAGVAAPSDLHLEDEEFEPDETEGPAPFVFIVEAGQVHETPYAPRSAFEYGVAR